MVTELTPAEKGRITTLRTELAHVRKVKEEYVKEHPEHRNLVYANSNRRPRDDREAGTSGPDRKLFGKDGLPLHPERSIYYDPVLNPFGAPPPGMPYIERREFLP
jgi:WW domain-binding protein 11